ncbi:hypothetical protein V8E36_003131 [Tilletia maclaganii]
MSRSHSFHSIFFAAHSSIKASKIMKFFAFASAALLLAAMSVSASVLEARDRDTTYPACDSQDGSVSHRQRATSQPVQYVKPGNGACGPYTDNDLGICVKPGFVKSGHRNHCGEKVALRSGKHTVRARVIDVCGATSDSPLGCNDIYLTKAAFVALGGDTSKGKLDEGVKWFFLPYGPQA